MQRKRKYACRIKNRTKKVDPITGQVILVSNKYMLNVLIAI